MVKGWTLSPKIGTRARMSTLTILIQHRTGNSSKCNNKARKINKKIWKKKMKFSLLSDDMIVYIRNSKELKKKENPNAFSEVTGFKINNQWHFYILIMNMWKPKLKQCNLQCRWKKSKKTQLNGGMCHLHGLEASTL